MKTKLLKKVRKSYLIIKYDELPSNANVILRDCSKQHGLPFYAVWQNDRFIPFIGSTKTYKDAMDILIKKIVERYYEKFRHKNGKIEKVWWSNK